MELNFEYQVEALRMRAQKMTRAFSSASHQAEKFHISMPEDFQKDFLLLINQVNLSLMEDADNFYGYFLFQMGRELRFDLSSPTGINLRGAKYIIYFNPLLFLGLDREQMKSTIKHEILHVLSLHLIRAKQLKGQYHKSAINMAMDIVVNRYLDHLPPYATTTDTVNQSYGLKLDAYAPFEYYVEQLQTVIPLHESENESSRKHNRTSDSIETEYRASNTHDLWEETDDIDDKTLRELTEKMVLLSEKAALPAYLDHILTSLKASKGELPWNLYLRRLMGTVESNKKKTTTRRDRRQPDRLDLRGQLRDHKAKVFVALDTSGSISDEEFKQAMKEVLDIVKNYNHEITVIECDSEIRNTYPVRSIRDLKGRSNRRGSTKFSPVFEYANHNKVNLLVYFTDGKGEDRLSVIPRGYHVLWIISGRGEQLSLQNPYGPVKKLSLVEVKEDAILDIMDVDRGGYSMNNQEKI